jgi:DNA-binding transcriptional LysR family regulator
LEVQVDGPLTATEFGIGVAAAIQGVGLVQLPLPYLAPELAAGRLVTVLADWVLFQRLPKPKI